MKKKITRQISRSIILAMILFVIINYLLQAVAAQRDMIAASENLFWQLEQLIEENDQNYETAIEDFRDIFNLLANGGGYTLYAIDPESYRIIGSTSEEFTGRKLSDIGISIERLEKWEDGFHCRVGNEICYCIFRQEGAVILGCSYNIMNLYSKLNRENIFLVCYIAVLLFLVAYSIYRYIDKNVVRSIELVNEKLGLIADGNLSERVEVRDSEEFAELSTHINYMVSRLLGTTEKISALLDVMELPIGVFEYNIHMPDVRTTRRMALIIGVEGEDAKELFGDYKRFERWIGELMSRPAEYADGAYILPGVRERYIQIYTFEKGSDRYGLVIDKTEEVRRCRELELKLAEDELTKLCSRRSFYYQLDLLFQEPEQLGHAVMMLVDSDDLKTVNDTYGHENGDHYLCGIAQVLKNTGAAKQVTARIGGDEFAVFIYGAKDDTELDGYLRKLLESRDVAVIALTSGESFPIRFSIGCAYYSGEKTDHHELLELADSRMYADKQQRKKNRR